MAAIASASFASLGHSSDRKFSAPAARFVGPSGFGGGYRIKAPNFSARLVVRCAVATAEKMDISGTGKPGAAQTAPKGRGKSKKRVFQAFAREQRKEAANLTKLARTGGGSGVKRPATEIAEAKKKKQRQSAADLLAFDENAEVRMSPVQSGGGEPAGSKTPAGHAETIDVSDGGSDDAAHRQGRGREERTDPSSNVLARRSRVKSYFDGRQWTEAEIADLELIMHKKLPVMDYDSLVERPYIPPYTLDIEDSALLDPTVAARVAHNAYLPADRSGMRHYDTDVMGSNMVSTMVKALNMATEFNIRVAEISRKETGLEGFKTRAEEAEVRALDAKKERDVLKSALEAEKKFSASSCEQVIALEAELGLLQKESATAALHLAEEKEAAENKAAEAELRAVKAENDLRAVTASLQATLQEKTALAEAKTELEKMCGQGFEAGFWECRDQIIRKFPEHGLDLTLLDSLEEGPEEEEEETEKGAEEAS